MWVRSTLARSSWPQIGHGAWSGPLARLQKLPGPAAGFFGLAALLGCLWVQQQAELLTTSIIWCLLIASLTVVVVTSYSTLAVTRWLSCLALAILFAMNAQLRSAAALSERLDPADEGRSMRVTGMIEQMPIAFDRGIRFVFRVEHCDTTDHRCPVGSRFRLSWYRDGRTSKLKLQPGQRWHLELRAKQVHGMLNPGLFDAELRAIEDGIAGSGYVRNGQLAPLQTSMLGRLWQAPITLIEQLRMHIRELMLQSVAGRNPIAAGVSVALVVGDQSAIGAPQWELFNRTGVGHLMSISGLHITMLAGLAAWLVGRIWRSSLIAKLSRTAKLSVSGGNGSTGQPLAAWLSRPLAQRSAAVVTAFGYSALAGWGVPAQRTCWMLLAAALASASGRAGSPMMVVAFALLPVLWLDPWACGSAGFWLSFSAVAAIIWYCDRQSYRGSRLTGLRDGVRAQLAVSVALIPLGALFFSSVALVSPLANAVAIPLVSFVVTPLSLLAALASLFSLSLAGWLLWLPMQLTEYLIKLLIWLEGFGGLQVLPYPSLAALVCAALAIVLLLSGFIPGRMVALFALLPLLLRPASKPMADEIWLTAFDIGQGMAVLIETASGRLLYDTGPAYGADNDAGARVLTPYLRGRGISHLERVVVSHLDQDHSGGTRTILRNFNVANLSSSIDDDDPLVKYASYKNVEFERCRRGGQWHWGAVRFEWLHPGNERASAQRSTTNANSCVLRVQSSAGSVLLTGDIEALQERRLLELYQPEQLRSTVLLAPHHGSKSSSSAAFLDAVQPQFALFQVGYRNRFKHPHPKVWARYQDTGAQLLRSDSDGAIVIRLKADQAAQVERYRVDSPRYWRIRVPL